MRKFIEKLLVILFCLYNTYKINPTTDLVFCFLISLIISISLDLFYNKKIKILFYLLFIIICYFNNLFIFYLPLILYNMYIDFRIYSFFPIPLILINFSLLNLLISITSVYLSIMTNRFNHVLGESKIVRDELKEDTIYLKRYNEQLKVNEEKNIHIAILTERNRIARELHDSIGHAISSSILQVEALKMISVENNIANNLNLLQDTLVNGMNDIRNSIHNLYDESLDLENKIQMLISEIPTIHVDLLYRVENDISYDLKFDILSITKEAITNCVKHSNATKIKISLMSQPSFYSIVIKDNGSKFDNTRPLLTKGIGLASMNEIASKYNGFLNYEFDQGFKIHLTLMKG